MSRDEAIKAMEDGHKIIHWAIDPGWFTIINNKILFENRQMVIIKQFWKHRKNQLYDHGYAYFDKKFRRDE